MGWGRVFRRLRMRHLLAAVVALSLASLVWGGGEMALGVAEPRDDARFSVVVNTFRRNDLLERFVNHYARCGAVDTIHIVWSDQERAPPGMSLFDVPEGSARVRFEVMDSDSLNHRFRPIDELRTDGIFSVDDDILMDCDTLRFAHEVWRSSPRVLVGFVPRMHERNAETGQLEYVGWWRVWWNGLYSIILTKACFLHKDYLHAYTHEMPAGVLEYVHEGRNCEDIAMSFLVAQRAQAPSVWVKGDVVEIGGGAGISRGTGHWEKRSRCLNEFERMFGENPLVAGHQKAERGRNSWLW